MIEINKIYNMDCLEGMKEIPDQKDNPRNILVITDPPYGDVLKKSGWIHQPNIQQGMAKTKDYTNVDFESWDTVISGDCINELFRISTNQVIFGGNYFELPPSPCWIVWDKDNGDNDFADCELAWASFKTAVRKFKYRWNGFLVQDPTHKEERVHPTQKPVKLFEWIIKNYAKEGDIICDPFFGSGSCLVAAVRLGYDFIGFEKEKTYFDAASVRIKKARAQGKLGEWFE